MIFDLRAAGCAASVLASVLASLTGAPAMAQTLSLAVSAPVTSIDPHYHTLSPNQSLDAQIFDPLVDMDATAHPVPALAESWKLVDSQTWEFHLRTTNFHNGAPFTAEDVAFTLDRVPRVLNSPGSFSIYTKAVTGVEIVDPHTIRLRTSGVYPLLPIDLTQVSMLSRSIGANPLTEDFNSGKNAIGTGPFKFVAYKPGDRIELDRNDAYWGAKPAWEHVNYRIISNDAARTSALLAGDVSLIDAVPTSDYVKLSKEPKVTLAQIVGLRLIFLWLDHQRDVSPFVEGPNGEKLDHNPLKDLRVRQALSFAINRPAIVSQVMEDSAIPSGQFLPKGSYSYVPDLAAPPYDPARARKLLAEAGYPKGFRITLHGSNDRYVNDAKIIQAVGQMWTRIGVQTKVEALPWASYVGHASKLEYSAFQFGWGTSTGEASNPLRALTATYDAAKGLGTVNRGRYSNPALDQLIDKALVTADDGARETLLQQATRMAMDDVAIIPLHQQKNIWAMRKGLSYTARADEQTRAIDIRPVK
jgi:peptide/nickel transport system substrate-binding protein